MIAPYRGYRILFRSAAVFQIIVLLEIIRRFVVHY